MPATKQQIRQIIADNNLKSVAVSATGQLQGYPAGTYGSGTGCFPWL